MEEPTCPDYFVKLIHGAVSDYQAGGVIYTPYTPPIHLLYTPCTPPIQPLYTPYTPPIHPLYTPYADQVRHPR